MMAIHASEIRRSVVQKALRDESGIVLYELPFKGLY